MFALWVFIPFIGLLLSMALMPAWLPRVWHKGCGFVVAFWIGVFLWIWAREGTLSLFWPLMGHTLQHEYFPFIVLISALYVISSGIWMEIQAPPKPWVNTALLALGACLAAWIGTMGASIVLIRPFLWLNRERAWRLHHFLFFIFIVSNVGGVLTPLGDPPLFMGFLEGVDFFWPLQHLWKPWLMTGAILLLLFYGIDRMVWQREDHTTLTAVEKGSYRVHVRGGHNVIFLLGVIASTLLESKLRGMSWTFGDMTVKWFDGAHESTVLLLTFLSWRSTAPSIREHNTFSWEPVQEVAWLFLGLFITMIPVVQWLNHDGVSSLSMGLKAADGGWHAPAFFWYSGFLSSFLDNAPTYLLFFHVAGGNAATLMHRDAHVLEAISLGSVFMGALTYIGNAPNMMVRLIAQRRHIHVPSFFAYMGYASLILLPVFYVVSRVFLS